MGGSVGSPPFTMLYFPNSSSSDFSPISSSTSVNLKNLAKINCDNVLYEKINNIRISSLNAQSARNKVLELKDIIEEIDIDNSK